METEEKEHCTGLECMLEYFPDFIFIMLQFSNSQHFFQNTSNVLVHNKIISDISVMIKTYS